MVGEDRRFGWRSGRGHPHPPLRRQAGGCLYCGRDRAARQAYGPCRGDDRRGQGYGGRQISGARGRARAYRQVSRRTRQRDGAVAGQAACTERESDCADAGCGAACGATCGKKITCARDQGQAGGGTARQVQRSRQSQTKASKSQSKRRSKSKSQGRSGEQERREGATLIGAADRPGRSAGGSH